METNHVPLSDYLTLAKAARLLPYKPHPSALWRWCRKGLVARNGTRIRLQHGRVGGRLFTTAAWMREFFAAVAAADCEAYEAREAAKPPPPSCDNGGRARGPLPRHNRTDG